MKFILFMFPTIPCGPGERAALRPVAQNTHKFQQMLEEVGELAKIAEDLGFDTIATTEHHLHEEGLEMGCTSAFHHYIASKTNHIRVGPIGYVLPAWNPLRLAVETAWFDQLTRGRAIVGMARGYQTRWFNNMAQNYGGTVSRSGPTGGSNLGVAGSSADAQNRAIFEEVFDVLQLAWKNEPFTYEGKYWQYPTPIETGTEWPGHQWTEQYGTPGIVKDGRLQQLNVVPKPYQKPHPQLFTAFSSSESTITWAAKNGVVPTITTTTDADFKQKAELYRTEAAKHGRIWSLGQNTSSARFYCLGDDHEDAMKRADKSHTATYYRDFGGGFGFWEGFRLPGDEEKYPLGKARLPESEWTMERLERTGHLFAGNASDIRGSLDKLVETANPEFNQVSIPQGFVPFEEQVRQLRIFGEQILPHYR